MYRSSEAATLIFAEQILKKNVNIDPQILNLSKKGFKPFI